jgi:hypothetical protein
MEAAMSRRIGEQTMDHKTSIAVCRGIGESLRRVAATESGALPDRLRDLLEELQRRDGTASH